MIVTGLDAGLGALGGGFGRKTGGLVGAAAAGAGADRFDTVAESLGAAVGLGGDGLAGGPTSSFFTSLVGDVGLRIGGCGLTGGDILSSTLAAGTLGAAFG